MNNPHADSFDLKIVRKFKLTSARHQPSDRISETAWLQKESRIR